MPCQIRRWEYVARRSIPPGGLAARRADERTPGRRIRLLQLLGLFGSDPEMANGYRPPDKVLGLWWRRRPKIRLRVAEILLSGRCVLALGALGLRVWRGGDAQHASYPRGDADALDLFRRGFVRAIGGRAGGARGFDCEHGAPAGQRRLV